MKLFASIFLALVLSAPVVAETIQFTQDGIDLTLSVEPTSFTVGDTVSVHIEATTSSAIQLTLAGDGAFGAFTVTEESSLLDIPVKDGRQWIWSLKLDTFDAAITALPSIALNWTDANGLSGTVTSNPIPVQVNTVAGEALQEMELRDIKSSVPLFSALSWWPVAAVVAIVLVIFAWIIRRIISKRCEVVLSPYEQAMIAINTLRTSDAHVHEFYTTLSSIVRTFIEQRFHITAKGQTTREFLIAEKENPMLEHSDRKALADFLVAADLVKFARFEPNSSVATDAIDRAEEFISNTVKTTINTAEVQRSEVAA